LDPPSQAFEPVTCTAIQSKREILENNSSEVDLYKEVKYQMIQPILPPCKPTVRI